MDPAWPLGEQPWHGQATVRSPRQISGPRQSPVELPQDRAGEEPLRAVVPGAESASSGPATSNATSPQPSRNDLPPQEPGNSRQGPSPVPSLTPHQRSATEPQSGSALIDRHFSIYLLLRILKRESPGQTGHLAQPVHIGLGGDIRITEDPDEIPAAASAQMGSSTDPCPTLIRAGEACPWGGNSRPAAGRESARVAVPPSRGAGNNLS
jgi:hypothetical protein